jgi:hypothetical protein
MMATINPWKACISSEEDTWKGRDFRAAVCMVSLLWYMILAGSSIVPHLELELLRLSNHHSDI